MMELRRLDWAPLCPLHVELEATSAGPGGGPPRVANPSRNGAVRAARGYGRDGPMAEPDGRGRGTVPAVARPGAGCPATAISGQYVRLAWADTTKIVNCLPARGA
jgi:hypothetical protein